MSPTIVELSQCVRLILEWGDWPSLCMGVAMTFCRNGMGMLPMSNQSRSASGIRTIGTNGYALRRSDYSVRNAEDGGEGLIRQQDGAELDQLELLEAENASLRRKAVDLSLQIQALRDGEC